MLRCYRLLAATVALLLVLARETDNNATSGKDRPQQHNSGRTPA